MIDFQVCGLFAGFIVWFLPFVACFVRMGFNLLIGVLFMADSV